MRSKLLINPVVRIAVIVSILLTLVSGVTFAALQSQSRLTGSSIQTATANLLVGKDTATLSNTSAGYAFSNLIPGGTLTPSGGFPVFLKNAGGTPLALKFSVSSVPTNLNGVDLSKVIIHLNSTASGQSQAFPLQTLVDSYATGGSTITLVPVLFSEQTHPFTMQVSMAKDAFDGQTAAIGAIDFVITGTATS